MFEEERLQKIAGYVQSNTRASVHRLCELFGVSESTVRRDLNELEKRRLLKRTHGGAVCLESVGFEPTYSEKEDQYREEKQSIAERAAAMIEDGESLLIDAGTTTLYLVPHLSKFKLLTVVTNSILLLQQLAPYSGITLMSTGGTLRPNTMALVGPVAESFLGRIRVDKAFIATNGIEKNMGLTTPNISEASVKEKMMQVSEQVFVLADHTKIGRVSFARFGMLSEIDGCITSDLITDEQKLEFVNRGVCLYLVENSKKCLQKNGQQDIGGV
ncbi:MAG: DeoR/GlpR family DNA-binding transcription regulator [Ethanoligenens sp.]